VKIPNLAFNVPEMRLNLDSIHRINFTKVIHALDQPILTINLDQIITELTHIQANEESDSQSRLLNEIVFLNGMNSFIYRPLIELVNKSLDGIRRVEKMKNEFNVKEIEELIKMQGLAAGNLRKQVSASYVLCFVTKLKLIFMFCRLLDPSPHSRRTSWVKSGSTPTTLWIPF